MKNDPLKIVAAAYLHRGTIFTGSRHYRIIQDIACMLGERVDKNSQDGFMTNRGEFVNRTTGAAIAREAKQIPVDFTGTLFSEDLWPDPESTTRELAGIEGKLSISNAAWQHAFAHANGNMDTAIDEVFEMLIGRYVQASQARNWDERNKIYSANATKKIIRENYKKWKRGELI